MGLFGYLFVWFTLLLALCLQVMPLPDVWLVWRPDWLGVLLAYWCVATPQRVGVIHGFVLGLLLDLIEGAPLGQNALTLSLLAYLFLLLYQRFRVYSLPSEPPREGHALLDALHEPLNLIVTPHNAWISPEARQRVVTLTADNLRAWRH